MTFKNLGEIICSVATLLEPPERITVAQSAAKYRYVNQPGAYVGPWLNETTPYMVEPMNEFTSPKFEGIIFIGPAQCGKTDALLLNAVSYSIKIDPMDTMIVCPTNTAARDFSMRRIDRLHTHSEQIGQMLLPGAAADNVFDKHYSTGMILTLSWPTPTELAGKPIGRVLMTDRDRMDDDIAGDGEPFDLASKRTTTFGSYAMTVCESSPSRPVENLKWIPSSPHEAPPAAGIMTLYNRGDRRRWYWPCPHCQGYFEGKFEHLQTEHKVKGSNMEIAATVTMKCPLCFELIHPDERHEMNLWGTWVKDGQGIDSNGLLFGPAPRTRLASFWLRGVAAAFISWRKLYGMYLDALDDYERTGSEEGLRKFYNNDLGEPYYPKSTQDIRLPETLKARAEPMAERKVPPGVRLLVATIDVQKNMFIVQVYGILPGQPFDIVIVDRFDVRYSKRRNEDDEREWVKPHVYADDWNELIEHVIEKEYEVDDGSGRLMGIKQVGCDSGGREGVTGKAYEFYRHLRKLNKHGRFILLKGEGLPNQPRTRITTPDSGRKDQKAIARGDIPVMMINSNLMKDDLNGRLDSIIPGKGMIRFPDWLSISFYNEMCAETRTEKGWENLAQVRNEAWDLTYYCIALCISQMLRLEHIDWGNAPSWASDWDRNDFVRTPEKESIFEQQQKSSYDFASFGKALA